MDRQAAKSVGGPVSFLWKRTGSRAEWDSSFLSSDGELAYHIENEGKIWKAAKDGVSLMVMKKEKQQENGSLVRFF